MRKGGRGGRLDFLADITVPPEFNSTHIPPWIILADYPWDPPQGGGGVPMGAAPFSHIFIKKILREGGGFLFGEVIYYYLHFLVYVGYRFSEMSWWGHNEGKPYGYARPFLFNFMKPPFSLKKKWKGPPLFIFFPLNEKGPFSFHFF
uniref:Uncharacterized protein n=1 Tax=Morchella brunnea TaxID=1174671 RepID=A0A8K1MER5_9PEZI|nr:hypothetical protein LK370_mgp131 [Morchella brunnea]UBU98389.1 hypothetical protein [Morchella brunnea]